MANRVDENLVHAFRLGSDSNIRSGNWLAAEFKQFGDIADYLNDAKVNILPEKIIFTNNRFYVLFLVDSRAKVQRKTIKKKEPNNGKRSSI